MKKFILLSSLCILSACGYKGDLYLPKEDDKNQFGVIQTGLEFSPPSRTASEVLAPQE
ncbi:LPS translocon maturation chaperone LptM [Alysiella crassa]|uniref:LPS translocon maturation chaperone LptM n=1 Tax=Alysiella crassa TaxID=153491 RepID=UPI0009FE6E01|nr:lipoprotein [Alysiella crassa]UOP06577.1 lipoprotein [Alysiella crassa]